MKVAIPHYQEFGKLFGLGSYCTSGARVPEALPGAPDKKLTAPRGLDYSARGTGGG